MVAKEETTQGGSSIVAHNNVNTTVTTAANTADLQQQQSKDHQQNAYLPKASPPPQIVIIPATQASTVATNAARKIRRALSMPRNPFRWSRKFKTTSSVSGAVESELGVDGSNNSAETSCVGGGRGRTGSIVSLNSCDAIVCNHTNGAEERGAVKQGVDASSENLPINKTIGKLGSGTGDPNNGGSSGSNRIFRRSSFRKFLNRIAQHVSGSVNVGTNKHASFTVSTTTDRVPPIGSYQWPPDQTPGVMGLKNHGNTCFMNAVLQCLSHTDILAEYFVLDQYKADLKRRNKINSRKFGTKGELTEQLANVLKALWTCKNESDHSTSFKAVVDRYGSQFRSSTQHDAQEFLFWLLDKVHEDLNTATKRRYKSVKNNYGRPDEVIAAETLANHIRCNNSFVQAVFQAQFRSSLTCPRCKKQSNTFDPFHCISVQLPQLTQQTIFATVVYLKQQPRQLKLGLTVPAGSPIVALREQLQKDTGISADHMVLADVNKEGFTRVFYDTQPVATLIGIETIYCIEVPDIRAALTGATVATTASIALSANSRWKSTASTNETSTNIAQAESSLGIAENKKSVITHTTDLLILVANVRKKKKNECEGADTSVDTLERFGAPFCLQVPRDSSYTELQKKLLREMAPILKPEVFSYATPLTEMFQVHLQDPSADPNTYLEQVEHPLLTEMIDLALSVLSAEAGPAHIKLLLEWSEPEKYFADLSDNIVEHESVARLLERKPNDTAALTLEQCLEHYTKAETLSAEDAWRCPHCQQYLPVVKTLGLWSLPDILVVHFKRFRQHQEKGSNAAKLTTMVTFPLNSFDMSPHLARGPDECGSNFGNSTDGLTNSLSHMYRPSPWKKTRPGDSRSSTLNSRDNRETRYDLYAVCYHQGDTLETGHYTAACKNPYDHQWYKFDDQRVSKVPNESIEDEIINNEAYMLFYQRRTGEPSECSGSSSNSGDHWISRIAPPPQIPAEKLTLTGDKQEKVNLEVPTVAATIISELEQSPEKPEAKPVEIPKLQSEAAELTHPDGELLKRSSNVAPKESLAQMVVMEMKDEHLVDIEEIDYVDADVVNDDDKSDDELEALERTSKENSYLDNSKQTVAIVHCGPEDLKKSLVAEEATISDVLVTPKPKSSPLLPVASSSPEKRMLTNGFAHSKSPLKVNGLVNGSDVNGGRKSPQSTGSSTASSSTSSLSSRSSPHSLAVSVHGASTLQTKFNGYSGSFCSANHHYQKEALLSSSLKSNSSSIIGAAVVAAAHSHEFQLSRHQHHHWNGSRSSVSAVENTTQQAQPHTHCLNLRHSFSTSSNYKLRECSETLTSMLRNSANTCSKDTLIFIDQQNHHHNLIEDDDETFIGRSLWISPVTPHKLITVSPKN